jgi:hypothetical protein
VTEKGFTRLRSASIALISLTAYVSSLLSAAPITASAQPRPQPQTPASAPSEPVMITVRVGDPAPFTGTLFSTSAAARLLADLELTQERCDIQINSRVRLTEANMQLQIDTERARLTALQFRMTEVTRIKNDQIDFLMRQHRPRAWYESGEFWFGLGSVVGVIITVAAGYALGQAYN